MTATPNELKLLRFLEHNEGATHHQIGDHFDASDSYARILLYSLERKKMIVRKKFIPGSVRLTQKGRESL